MNSTMSIGQARKMVEQLKIEASLCRIKVGGTLSLSSWPDRAVCPQTSGCLSHALRMKDASPLPLTPSGREGVPGSVRRGVPRPLWGRREGKTVLRAGKLQSLSGVLVG